MVQIGPGSVTCRQYSLALSFTPDQGPSVSSLSQCLILLISYHFIYIIYPQRNKFVSVLCFLHIFLSSYFPLHTSYVYFFCIEFLSALSQSFI